jgi:hypothetical protein
MSDHDGGRSSNIDDADQQHGWLDSYRKSGSCSTYGVSIHSSSCPDRHFLLPVWLAVTYYYSSCSPMYRDSSDPNDPPPRESKKVVPADAGTSCHRRAVELHIDGLIAGFVSQDSIGSLVTIEKLTRECAAFPSWPSFVETRKTTRTPTCPPLWLVMGVLLHTRRVIMLYDVIYD